MGSRVGQSRPHPQNRCLLWGRQMQNWRSGSGITSESLCPEAFSTLTVKKAEKADTGCGFLDTWDVRESGQHHTCNLCVFVPQPEWSAGHGQHRLRTSSQYAIYKSDPLADPSSGGLAVSLICLFFCLRNLQRVLAGSMAETQIEASIIWHLNLKKKFYSFYLYL